MSDITSPTSPVAPYPPIAVPAYRSRSPEFYGFVAWTSTYLLFFLYLLWALLPDEWIVWLGIVWYPNREWALLIPAYGMFLVLLTYFVYFALAFSNTPQFSDITTINDSHSRLPPYDHTLPMTLEHPDAIPELHDIPITLVNRVVYGNHNDASHSQGQAYLE